MTYGHTLFMLNLVAHPTVQLLLWGCNIMWDIWCARHEAKSDLQINQNSFQHLLTWILLKYYLVVVVVFVNYQFKHCIDIRLLVFFTVAQQQVIVSKNGRGELHYFLNNIIAQVLHKSSVKPGVVVTAMVFLLNICSNEHATAITSEFLIARETTHPTIRWQYRAW